MYILQTKYAIFAMRGGKGNAGKINLQTIPKLLNKIKIPKAEIHM